MSKDVANASEVLEMFSGRKLLVVGDLVADEYVYGTTSRISREAPVLIVREDRREIRPGGAANVVANIKAMGGEVWPLGLVGDDDAGKSLLDSLTESGVDCSGIVVDQARITTTKTRVLAGGRNTVRQQMIRMDRLSSEPLSDRSRDEILARFQSLLDEVSAVVVSDYGEGVVGDGLIELICQEANKGVRVFVDSRFRVGSFHSVGALVPNEPELAAAFGEDIDEPENLERAGRWLLDETGSKTVLLKRGRNGMALFQAGRPTKLQGAYGSAEVADVTGAGDTVLAAWSLANLAGASPELAMKIANMAGGIKVGKAGTAVVSHAELSKAISDAGI